MIKEINSIAHIIFISDDEEDEILALGEAV
jgi:hypothetical protein